MEQKLISKKLENVEKELNNLKTILLNEKTKVSLKGIFYLIC